MNGTLINWLNNKKNGEYRYNNNNIKRIEIRTMKEYDTYYAKNDFDMENTNIYDVNLLKNNINNINNLNELNNANSDYLKKLFNSVEIYKNEHTNQNIYIIIEKHTNKEFCNKIFKTIIDYTKNISINDYKINCDNKNNFINITKNKTKIFSPNDKINFYDFCFINSKKNVYQNIKVLNLPIKYNKNAKLYNCTIKNLTINECCDIHMILSDELLLYETIIFDIWEYFKYITNLDSCSIFENLNNNEIHKFSKLFNTKIENLKLSLCRIEYTIQKLNDKINNINNNNNIINVL
jgi:hypothetical protein